MNKPNNQKRLGKERKFNQEQYEMLLHCSKKGDMTGWNEWREVNPAEEVLLEGANLKNTNLLNAHLEDANLEEANLQGAYLLDANLKNANLYSAHLENAKLWNAHLENANLYRAHLENADLSHAHLENANLRFAYLKKAVLYDAHLENADLIYANLKNAYLSYSYIKETNFEGVFFNRKTRCINMGITDYKGSYLFKKYIDDEQYLCDFKEKYKIIYWLWLISCDCGRSLLRWAFWSLVLAIGFGLVYYKLGQEAFKVSELPWNFSTVVYYSVVTFTTLGFGDVVPKTNGAAWWITAEVIAGYVMLGGLISIFANKLARRS